MHKKAEESSIQYSRGVDAAVCVRALQMCVCVCVCVRARGKLLTQRATVTPTIPSVLYAGLVPSGSAYIESWLNENARVGGNALTDIMCKCGQCQNKDAFLYDRYRYFTRGIDASYRHISYWYIDASLHLYYLSNIFSWIS